MKPTIEEFKRAVRVQDRRRGFILLASVTWILLSLIGGALSDTLLAPWIGVASEFLIPAAFLFIGIPGMFYGFWLGDRQYKRFPELVCSACGKSLATRHACVVSSGNCPSCGRRVIEDPNLGA